MKNNDLTTVLAKHREIKNIIRLVLSEIDFSTGQLKGWVTNLCWFACEKAGLVGFRGNPINRRHMAQWIEIIAHKEFKLLKTRWHNNQCVHYITPKGKMRQLQALGNNQYGNRQKTLI